MSGGYSIEGGKIFLTIEAEESVISFTYNFTDKNKRVTLIDSEGSAAVYIRV